MAAKQITGARFFNRIDTSDSWVNASSILGNGEFGIVTIGSAPSYILIGDGSTPADVMIQDEAFEYDKNKIYLGKGAQYEFTLIASDGQLGGIKLKDHPEDCGLSIDEEGYLTNALQSGWDVEKQCFVVNKLYIRSLITDEKQEQDVFKSDRITLRYEANGPLGDGEFAGVDIENIDGEGETGFFGIDNQNRFVLRKGTWDYWYAPFVQITDFTTSGFLMYNSEEADWELTYLKTLNITNGEDTFAYNGTVDYSINITPPTITLNAQELTYDDITRSYTGTFDGGLTEETKASIDQAVTNSTTALEETNNMKLVMLTSEKITIQPGTNITVNTTAGQGEYSAIINHETIVTTQTSTASESIKVDSDKSFTFITGIEVENGHVVSITTSSYQFVS